MATRTRTTRMSRVEQVERNRDLVLDSARQVFLDRGYGGATLEAIALEAGFSKGVVYSQFESKADLFFALLERRIDERAAENDRATADHAGLEGLLVLLRTNARLSVVGGGWARLLIEFRILAARDPELSRRYGQLHARAVDRLADTAASVLARDGLAPVFPPRVFAGLIFAIDSGLVLERAADPASLPVSYLEDLTTRLVEPTRPPPPHRTAEESS